MRNQKALREKILQAIYHGVEEINEQLSPTQRLKKTEKTILFGKSGKLDSLGLVNLIVGVEEKIREELEVPISLANERALSQKNSPFRTIQTLADYITLLLQELRKT